MASPTFRSKGVMRSSSHGKYDDNNPPPVAPRPQPKYASVKTKKKTKTNNLKTPAIRVRSLNRDLAEHDIKNLEASVPHLRNGSGSPVEISQENVYLTSNEIASIPKFPPTFSRLQERREIQQNAYSLGPSMRDEGSNDLNHQVQHDYSNRSVHLIGDTPDLDTAVYGAAQGKGVNLVMEWTAIVHHINSFYKKVINTPSEDPQVKDFKTHLKISETSNVEDLLNIAYERLSPASELENNPYHLEKEIFLLDFTKFRSAEDLRGDILKLLITVGTPSTNLKVGIKMNSLIRKFCDIAIELKNVSNETIKSPAHIQHLLQGEDSDALVKTFQENELWIKWGTKTNLPPLYHIYMLKNPPSYEIRKAVTLSMISERKERVKQLLELPTECMIPPIYSRLLEPRNENEDWQVTKYNMDLYRFQTNSCSLPKWVTKSPKLMSHLLSSNRGAFKPEAHLYDLYTVYIIVIKDFEMDVNEEYVKENKLPCKYQLYIGASSTGVLFRFAKVEGSHCENMFNAMKIAVSKNNFRCTEGCDLVDACMVLSHLNRTQSAVFVVNSFHEEKIESLPLEFKKKFHEKMNVLQQHFINGKKLGCTTDMRTGMNFS